MVNSASEQFVKFVTDVSTRGNFSFYYFRWQQKPKCQIRWWYDSCNGLLKIRKKFNLGTKQCLPHRQAEIKEYLRLWTNACAHYQIFYHFYTHLMISRFHKFYTPLLLLGLFKVLKSFLKDRWYCWTMNEGKAFKKFIKVL